MSCSCDLHERWERSYEDASMVFIWCAGGACRARHHWLHQFLLYIVFNTNAKCWGTIHFTYKCQQIWCVSQNGSLPNPAKKKKLRPQDQPTRWFFDVHSPIYCGFEKQVGLWLVTRCLAAPGTRCERTLCWCGSRGGRGHSKNLCVRVLEQRMSIDVRFSCRAKVRNLIKIFKHDEGMIIHPLESETGGNGLREKKQICAYFLRHRVILAAGSPKWHQHLRLLLAFIFFPTSGSQWLDLFGLFRTFCKDYLRRWVVCIYDLYHSLGNFLVALLDGFRPSRTPDWWGDYEARSIAGFEIATDVDAETNSFYILDTLNNTLRKCWMLYLSWNNTLRDNDTGKRFKHPARHVTASARGWKLPLATTSRWHPQIDGPQRCLQRTWFTS